MVPKQENSSSTSVTYVLLLLKMTNKACSFKMVEFLKVCSKNNITDLEFTFRKFLHPVNR